MQRYTIYLWKLLYMFRVVSPPIIRSTHKCICSIWYLSNRYCYLPTIVEELELRSETCRAVSRDKLCNVASCWIYRV